MRFLLLAISFLFVGCLDDNAKSGKAKSGSFESINSEGTNEITLSWTKPLKYVDDSSLSETDIAAYIVYAGSSPASLEEIGRIEGAENNSYLVSNLIDGEYYFAISVETIYGDESAYSNIEHKIFK